MKKGFSVLLIICLLFLWSACATKGNEAEETAPENVESAEPILEVSEQEDEPVESSEEEPSKPEESQSQIQSSAIEQSVGEAAGESAPQTEQAERSGAVEMTLAKDAFDTAPQQVEVIITNNTNERLHKNREAIIQYYNGSSWETIPIEFIFNSIYEYFEMGETDTFFYPLNPSEHSYVPGRYRVYLTGFELSAEFTVSGPIREIALVMAESVYTGSPEVIQATIQNKTNGEITLTGNPVTRVYDTDRWLSPVAVTADNLTGVLQPGETRPVQFYLASDYPAGWYMLQIPEMGLYKHFEIKGGQ